MKFLKILLYIVGSILFILLIMVATMVTTIDRTPYQEMSYYKEWKENIAKVSKQTATDTAAHTLKAGWAKVNITPASPGPMAGYGKRRGKHYEAVHDSIYLRTVIFDNGMTKSAIITADMLIMPPNIVARVKELYLRQVLLSNSFISELFIVTIVWVAGIIQLQESFSQAHTMQKL